MEISNKPQVEKSNGALVGSIVIIFILIVGGVYLLKENIRKMKEMQVLKSQAEQERVQIISAPEIIQQN